MTAPPPPPTRRWSLWVKDLGCFWPDRYATKREAERVRREETVHPEKYEVRRLPRRRR